MADTAPAYTTLIQAGELAAHLGQPGWVLIDCRHDLADPYAGLTAYAAGHLPGAQFASIDHDLSDKALAADGAFRGRHPLPAPAAFIAKLRTWGIDDATQVIAYDAQGGMFAARLWWMLRWVGHAQVAVLDGGLPAWADAGLPLSEAVTPAPGLGTIAQKPALVGQVGAADIIANLDRGERVVIDARAPDRFRGDIETLDPVGGHIPGAKNRFFKENLQADGRFKPAGALHTAFTALCPDPAQAIMQCGSGVTACHNLLAMEIAGLAGASLYPGSWSEWCADGARPVAIGAASPS